MNAKQLTIKCYAEHKEGVWSALCLDFNIASQADTFEEAKKKLESMIEEYLYDIFEGEDKEFATQLLNRRAPLLEWCHYYYLGFLSSVFNTTNHVFQEIMPLRLA